MKKNIKLKKLDKRNNGYGEFRFYIEYPQSQFQEFIKVRNWAWEQWGPSCELDFWYKDKSINPAWCWLVDEWRIRLYFKSDTEAQWFILKWQ